MNLLNKFHYKIILSVFLTLNILYMCSCQIIRSVSEIQKAFQLDGFIVQRLKQNISKTELTEETSLLINSYVDEWDESVGDYINPSSDIDITTNDINSDALSTDISGVFWKFASEPEVALITARRLSVDWPKIKKLLHKSQYEDLLKSIESKEYQVGLSLNEDLHREVFPAVSTLARVEAMYRLPQHCFSYQPYTKADEDTPMYRRILKSKDAVLIATKLLFENHLFWAYRWLLTAKQLLRENVLYDKDNSPSSADDKTSAASPYYIRNKYLELLFNITLNELDKKGEHHIINHVKKMKEPKIKLEPRACQLNDTVQMDFEDNNGQLNQEGLISILCRGKDVRPDFVTSILRCYYDSRKSAWLTIMPVKVEELSRYPEILYFHGLVSKGELKSISTMVVPLLTPSTVGDGHVEVDDIRTSYVAWMKSNSTHLVENINFKIAQFTGLNIDDEWRLGAEILQINVYGTGGHYMAHHDFFSLNDKKMMEGSDMVHHAGDRIATAMLYMTDDFEGGNTVFPILGISISPVAGSFVYWKNLLPSGKPDMNTLHSACAVRKGIKIVANKWIKHDPQVFKLPCELTKD